MFVLLPVCRLKHSVGILHNQGGMEGNLYAAIVERSIGKSCNRFSERIPNVGIVVGFL